MQCIIQKAVAVNLPCAGSSHMLSSLGWTKDRGLHVFQLGNERLCIREHKAVRGDGPGPDSLLESTGCSELGTAPSFTGVVGQLLPGLRTVHTVGAKLSCCVHVIYAKSKHMHFWHIYQIIQIQAHISLNHLEIFIRFSVFPLPLL